MYVVFDIEFSPTNLLFGFFIPLIDTYLTYSFTSYDLPEVFNKNRKFLGDFINYLISDLDQTSKTHDYKDTDLEIPQGSLNEGAFSSNYVSNLLSLHKDSPELKKVLNSIKQPIFAPIVLTFNGNNFDWIVLTQFMNYNAKGVRSNFDLNDESPEDCFSIVTEICTKIFTNKEDIKHLNQAEQKKRQLTFTERFHLISQNIISLDLYPPLYEKESLLEHKYRLFFEKDLKFPPIELFDSSKGIDKANIPFDDFTYLYNFNDLFYTYLLFLHPPKGLSYEDLIFSRLLFHEEFMETSNSFNFSLKIKDPKLAEGYFQNKFKIESKGKAYEPLGNNKKVALKDLIICHDYPLAFPKYREVFEKVDDYKNYRDTSENPNNIDPNFVINVCNCDLQLSVGGMHTTNDALKTDSSQGLVTFKECSEFTYLDLDFMGFYVVLLLKIYESTNKTFYDILLNLFNLRNELKKQGNKANLIYKIITLALSGKLNELFKDYAGKLFDPIAYYSMTANGQLTLLEFILTIEKYIHGIVMVNTDGCTLKVKKNELEELFPLITKFEKDYGFSFNDRFIVKKGIMLHVNKYLFKQTPLEEFDMESYKKANSYYEANPNTLDDIKDKGFSKRTLTYVRDVFRFLLNENTNEGICYSLKFEDLVKSFYTWKGEFKNEKLYTLFNVVKSDKNSAVKETQIYYFSQNPKSFNGCYAGNNRFLEWSKPSEIPINALMLKNSEFKREDLIKDITRDICYFQYFYNTLKPAKIELNKLNIGVEEFKKINENLIFDINNHPIAKTMNYLLKRNISPTLKKENKMSFTGGGLRTKSLEDIRTYYFQDRIETTLVKSKAVSIFLLQAYPYIVLDFDDISKLYFKGYKTTPSMNSFLKMAIDSSCLIVGTPRIEGPSTFKILLKIVDPEPLGVGDTELKKKKLDHLKNILKEINNNLEGLDDTKKGTNFRIAIEEDAILVGAIHDIYRYENFFENILKEKDPFEISTPELEKLLNNSSKEPFIEEPNLLRNNLFYARKSASTAWVSTYKTFTTKTVAGKLTDKPTHKSLENDWVKKNPDMNFQEGNLLREFQEINSKVLESQDSETKLKFMENFMPKLFEGPFDSSLEVSNPILINVTPLPADGSNEAFERLKLQYKKEFESFLKKTPVLEISDYNVSTEDLLIASKPFTLIKSTYVTLQSLVKDCNTETGLDFNLTILKLSDKNGEILEFNFNVDDKVFETSYEIFIEKLQKTPEELKRYHVISYTKFSSPCIFEKDTQKKVVSLDIVDGKSYISCWHADPCKSQNLYDPINNSFRAALLPLILLYKSDPFVMQEGSVSEFMMDPENLP